MQRHGTPIRGYLISTLLGSVFGGLAVLFITKAIPKMMSRMMCGMMRNMMAQMGSDFMSPEEM